MLELEELELAYRSIGSIELGDLGRDEYLLVTRPGHELRPDHARAWLKRRVHKPLKEIGGYYCNDVRAVQAPGESSSVICVIRHRYDV